MIFKRRNSRCIINGSAFSPTTTVFGIIIESPPTFLKTVFYRHCLLMAFLFHFILEDIVKYFQLSGTEIKMKESRIIYYYYDPYPAVCKRTRKQFLWHNWMVQSLSPSGVDGLLQDVPSCRHWIPVRNPSADRSTYSSCRDFSVAHLVDFSKNRLADNL